MKRLPMLGIAAVTAILAACGGGSSGNSASSGNNSGGPEPVPTTVSALALSEIDQSTCETAQPVALDAFMPTDDESEIDPATVMPACSH